MTTPQQPPPGQQQPPPQQQDDGLDDAALAVAIAALLAAAAVTAAYASSVALMLGALKARFALSHAAWQALGSVLTQVTASPPPVTGIIGAASEQTARQNAARRAQYVVAASKRVLGAAREARAKGEPVTGAIRDALATERRYYSQHLAAMWNRATAAGKTDMAALEHGPILGWNTVRDSKASAECLAADKKNFRADRMPDIGWPGGVHPFAAAIPARRGRAARCCLAEAA
ncbi:MAG TPA: hypothetical protein VGH53_00725 [Streptosporangiaceae bacterium]